MNVNNEIYQIIEDKLEGEALTKIQSVRDDEGFEAYRVMVRWYLQVNKECRKDRIRTAHRPARCITNPEVAESICGK